MPDRKILVLPFLVAAPAVAEPPVLLPRTAAEAERIAAVTVPATGFDRPEPYEGNPGGASTVPALATDRALAQPSAGMAPERELDFVLGNALFEKLWVASPSSTRASDGLGPLFNARSCLQCHIGDGRGHPPAEPGVPGVSMFLRVSIPAQSPPAAAAEIEGWIATAPDPVYGFQLQDLGNRGLKAEYRMEIAYEEVPVALSDGETASLRRPAYAASELGYGPLHAQAMLSPRVAPPMTGLGLLEAIPEADILARADPGDADGDGISGRPSYVPSLEAGRPMLGRFGWKAGSPTVRQQTAEALSNDIGISSPLFPHHWGDCTEAQTACRAAPDGGDPGQGGHEIDAGALDLVTFYARNLAVPARRGLGEAEVLRGKQVFHETGCIACHVPKFVTARIDGQPEQSFQLIWPYSDLLLHDMGEGLADHRPEGRATGREWKTPPLWGIGLAQQVSRDAAFLHDGRARSLLEAILWHGGEAQPHRDAVIAMPKPDRDALIAFLESL
ncbi:di-heme oxidoredictase family protein [Poseidonocella sp. HB161398]|uniref:di-heme oxidoreductase family protein n=1 Tax=Poseidonocella sp. HB161398 TaxID=2320855 RepID=UPI001109F351|nr:di-heme oxidoredictase family protein [Poseidonocella sp. HB161398]